MGKEGRLVWGSGLAVTLCRERVQQTADAAQTRNRRWEQNDACVSRLSVFAAKRRAVRARRALRLVVIEVCPSARVRHICV